MSQLVANLTHRMSGYLRSAKLNTFSGYEGDPTANVNVSSLKAVGVAWKEQTCLQVNLRWLYLSLKYCFAHKPSYANIFPLLRNNERRTVNPPAAMHKM